MLQSLPRVGLRCLPFAVLVVVASCASPQSTHLKPIAGYAQSDSGIARDSYNQCVQSGLWEKGMAIPECSPKTVARSETPAPIESAQAPAEPEPAAIAAAPAAAAAESAPEAETAAAAAATAPTQPHIVYLGTDAYFGFNNTELSDQAKSKLDMIAERANGSSDATVRVVGHSDQVGEEGYNMTLSQRRADAVRTYLIDRGIPEDSVQVEARGETDPIVGCEGQQGASLIDCLQVNRRTEVEFSALEPVER